MAYVQYAPDSVTITGVFANQQPDFATEFLPDSDAAVLAFIAHVTAPSSVTDKQFFQAAAQVGIITQAEAIAFMANGAFPATLMAAFAALPAGEQFAAKMAVLGARNFVRSDPFVVSLSQAMGKTPAEVDALFTLGASL